MGDQWWVNASNRSRETLILSTPAGLVAAVTTLACGWYSDRKVNTVFDILYGRTALMIYRDHQNERMLPIVFCVIPTIVGSAILVGLDNTNKKGALLFGAYWPVSLFPTKILINYRFIFNRHFSKCPVLRLFIQCEQHKRAHEESYYKCNNTDNIQFRKYNWDGNISGERRTSLHWRQDYDTGSPSNSNLCCAPYPYHKH